MKRFTLIFSLLVAIAATAMSQTTVDYSIVTGTGATGELSRTDNATTAWKDVFTFTTSVSQPATLKLQLTRDVNSTFRFDMKALDGGLTIATGASGNNDNPITSPTTCTLSVPAPWKIVSYSFDIVSDDATGITVTPKTGTGDAVTTSNTETKTVTATGINSTTAVFELLGANKTQTIRNFVVKVALDYNNGIYQLESSRGFLIYYSENSGVVASTQGYTAENDAAKQWCVYKSEQSGKYYLYNLGAQKFLGAYNTNGEFVWVESPDTDVKIVESTKNGYPFIFSTDGTTGAVNHHNHTETAPHVKNWDEGLLDENLDDDGSSHRMVYVSDVDAATLATIQVAVGRYENPCTVTYNYKDGDKLIATVSHELYVGAAYPEVGLGNVKGVTVTGTAPEGNVEEDVVVDIAVTSTLPFEYSLDIESISNWYYIRMNPEKTYYLKYNENCYNGNADIELTGAFDSDIDNHTWAFVGDPWSGFKLINKAAGTSKAAKLATGSVVEIVDYASSTNFFLDYGRNADNQNLSAFTDGLFSLHNGDASGSRYMNQRDNVTPWHVASWEQGLDRGSTMWVIECHELAVTDAGWASLCLDFNATIPAGVEVYAVTGVKDGNWLAMTPVTGVLPANTGVLVKANQGNYIFNETEDAPATIEGNLLEGTTTVKEVAVGEGYAAYGLAQVGDGAALCRIALADGKFSCNPNKAYLILEEPAGASLSSSLRFDFGGTTAVEKVEMRNEKEEIYDLQGRRIDEITEPGIYIVNGVKRVVR